MVSCSDDYDDDITNLKDKTTDLSTQLASLQTAQTANQSAAQQAADAAAKALAEAQEAAKNGDAATQEAKNAAAEAELAKKAAAEAKADAIAEAIAQLKPLIDAASTAGTQNAQAIAALQGKIEGIEKGLANIDLTDINKQLGDQATLIAENAKAIQALQVQTAALEKLQQDLTALSSTVGGLETKLTSIENAIKELNALSDDVKANTKSIEDIKAELSAVAGTISTEVGNAVNTLAGVLAQRLTSITLMPDLYVDGIPTIAFESAKYNKLVYKNGVWQKATKPEYKQVEYIVSNNETEAHYRLNPGTITNADIDKNGMGYVSRIATSRAAEVLNDIVTVYDANVENDGTLTVYLGKGNTDSLNLAGNKIYTASLKVPVASQHLLQGETEAAVYSEFTRLEEAFFLPQLAFVPSEYIGGAAVAHLNDSTALYNSAAGASINKNIVYNIKGGYDLYDLVEGCGFYAPSTHKPMTRKELQKYGFEIVFGLPTTPYMLTTPDNTDQQKFVKLSGENNSILTPVASNGVEGNKVIIGKQPIIRAELRDVVNGNMVDVRYFKVLFTAEDMDDIVIDWTEITTQGKPCEGASYDFTWKDMAEKVLMNIGENGMSKEDFNRIYGVAAPVITPANDQNGKLSAFVIANNADASIPVMTWSLTPDQLGVLKVGKNTVTVTKSIAFSDPTGLNPKVVINLKWTVTTIVDAATLGATIDLKWQNNTMKVYPVPMKLVNGVWDGTQAYYATNVLEGREKPYVLGLTDCATYDIDYLNNYQSVEALQYTAPYGHWYMTKANQASLNEIIFSLKQNAAGKQLASNGGTITLKWSTDINGLAKNRYQFATTDLQVVKILNLNTIVGAQIVDNSVSQTISIADNYTMTDAYGNLVAKVATTEAPLAADYYQYYGVQDPVFGNGLYIASDAEGKNKIGTPASLNMTADISDTTGELTFQNNGSPLQADAYIIVPVTVEHLWGTLEGKIAVPLKKSSAPLNRN